MKNGKPISLEQRLDRLEAEVRQLTAKLESLQPKQKTWRDFVGIYENDPVAQEVMRDVLEMREKERRKARRQRRKAKSKA